MQDQGARKILGVMIQRNRTEGDLSTAQENLCLNRSQALRHGRVKDAGSTYHREKASKEDNKALSEEAWHMNACQEVTGCA